MPPSIVSAVDWAERAIAVPAAGRSAAFCAGTTIVSVAAVFLVRWLLEPLLDDGAAFLPFILAILWVTLSCGSRAATIAALLSFVAGFYFGSIDGIGAGDVVQAGAFVVTAAGVIALGDLANRARLQSAYSDHLARQREQEARRIAEELDLLIDGAHDHAIYMIDASGLVTIWNTGAERLKGWSESEVLGKQIDMFYPPDTRASGKPAADLARARCEGRFEEEDRRLRKDGSEFLAAVSLTALFNAEGTLRGYAKVISDITERRAAEDMIAARESHLRSILATVPDAMVVIDETGAVLSFSVTAERLFGYVAADIVGCDVGILMPPPDQERHADFVRHHLDTGQKRIIGRGRVVFAKRKDGTIFPVELSIGEAIDDARQRIFIGFLRDLTERQRTQERLDMLQSELIHVSRVSAMGMMASTLAHELNQPIAAFTNYVEAVRDQLANPNPDDFGMMRRALGDAAKDALRAGQIVRRLRDFVGRGDIELTAESLPELINDAALLGLMGAREQRIEATFDIDPNASPVLVDRVQIQQVLINLIRNACEAVVESQVRRVAVTSRVEGSDLVRITVADTGPGIDEDMRERLFDAFVSTKAQGMGLGLSICRTIVEANGGRIWMEPREEGGAVFCFTVPRVRREDGDDGR